MVKREVTGAHYGLMDWLAQRVTAVVMAVYVVGFAALWLFCPPQDFDAWRGLFGGTFMRTATMIFLVSLIWHAWIGLRDILMDYIKPAGLRLILHVLVLFTLAIYTGWSVQILWSL
ncbi:MAG: succinate dehydrogenase, hydrophobic membrane anchor protein [Burkholderiales bacterium]